MTNPYESPPDHAPAQKVIWPQLTISLVAQTALGVVIAATVDHRLSANLGVALACICLLIAIVAGIAGLQVMPLWFRSFRLSNNVLTAHMLDVKDADYRRVFANARLGKPLYHQGIVFDLSPAERSAGRIVAASAIADCNEATAWCTAAHIEDVAAMLRDESPDFAELAADCRLVVRFFTSYDSLDDVVGEIDGGQLRWLTSRSLPSS